MATPSSQKLSCAVDHSKELLLMASLKCLKFQRAACHGNTLWYHFCNRDMFIKFPNVLFLETWLLPNCWNARSESQFGFCGDGVLIHLKIVTSVEGTYTLPPRARRDQEWYQRTSFSGMKLYLDHLRRNIENEKFMRSMHAPTKVSLPGKICIV